MIPKNGLNNDEAKKELDKIKEIEKNVDREKLVYERNEYTYSFENFQTIKTFRQDIYQGKITIKQADDYQKYLLVEIVSFKKHTKPRSLEKKQEKEMILKNLYRFLRVDKKFLTLLKAKYF